MPNNDVPKIDHEAALNAAKLLCDFFTFANSERGEARQRNLARAYLDLLAQRDEAEKLRDVAYGLLDVAVKERDEALALLEEAAERLASFSNMTGPKIRAFLAKHRKTGA